MIRTSARRLSLALILGATSLTTAVGSAHADGTTGTDPCPKGWLCNSGTVAPASTAAPVSVTGTVAQVALILLGVS